MTGQTDGGPGEFEVVPAEVADAGQFLQGTADTLSDGLLALDTDIESLLDTWSGTSAEAFRLGWEEAKAGAVTVLDALRSIAEQMGVSSRILAEIDEARSDAISSLDLPGL